MNLEQERRDDILILRPRGRLDSSSSPELERVVTEQLEAGTQRVVFDLSALDYISSAGLRVVLLAGKKLRASKRLAPRPNARRRRGRPRRSRDRMPPRTSAFT